MTVYPLGDTPVKIHSLFEKPNADVLAGYTGSSGVTGLLGLDVESTAFYPSDFWHDSYRLRLVQVATETEAWLLDPDDPDTASLLADERLSFVSHTNTDAVAAYVCLNVDIIDRWWDSYTMARLTPARANSCGLKALTKAYGMPELSEADATLDALFADLMKSAGHTVGSMEEAYPFLKGGAAARAFFGYTNVELTDPRYLEYSGLDAAACLRLLPLLAENLICDREALAVEMEVERENARLRIRGIRVDVPLAHELLETVPPTFEAAQAAFAAHTGGINTASGKQMREYFGSHGVDWDLWEDHGGALTDTGGPSLAKENWKVLRTFELTEEAATAVELYGATLETANAAKTIKQLCNAIGNDGRIHPKLKTLGTDTGRMSSFSPNLQNLKGRMRNIFLADPGHVMFSIDFDALEVKMGAAVSQDPHLLESVKPGNDIHQATADLLDIERKPAKTTTLGIMYGLGAQSLSVSLGLPYAEALQIFRNWWSAYSEMSRLNDGLKQRTDFVPLIDGRRVPAPRFGRKSKQAGELKGYANLNYLLQGSSTLALKARWLYICRVLGLRETVLLLIHDEYLGQVPEGDAETLEALLEATNFSYRGVQFTAGVAALYDTEGVSRWVDS